MVNNIVVAIGGTTHSLVTAKYAVCLAKLLRASLTGVCVVNTKALEELLKSKVFVEVEVREFEQDLEAAGRRFLDKIKKLAEDKRVDFKGKVCKGVVAEQVMRQIEDLEAGLLVMGQPTKQLPDGKIFCEEAEDIFRESKCPVVVVRDAQAVENLYKEL
ncbi:MAG: universal stress protein [Candidatus Omnitrophota bacterium]|nr:MAG: universal stress protein [Candidatus Omnitrophota bacterium]